MHNYSFELIILNIPFKYSYEHNLASRSVTDSLILVLSLNDRVCVGETTPRSYVTGESTTTMPSLVAKYLPIVLSQFDDTLIGLPNALDLLPRSQTALKCLIESALINYLVQYTNSSIFNLFEANKDKVLNYSAPITGGSKKTFEQMALLAAKNRMENIKLKIVSSPEDNLSRVLHLKQLCGEDSKIRMDGNEIWTFEQAKKEVPKLIEAGVSCFEQLFHKDDVKSYDQAFREWGADCELIVDESITDKNSLNQLISNKNIHGACLKISKNGGLLQSLEMAKILKENNLSIRLGCHVGECSYLSLLGLVFAVLAEPIDLEGALGPLLLDYDPFSPNITFGSGGEIHVTEEFRSKFGTDMTFRML